MTTTIRRMSPASRFGPGLLLGLMLSVPAGPARAQETRPAAKLQPPAQQQEPDQETLIELRRQKLAKPVFEQAAWRTDFDAARAEARERGKLLLVYFTRSYAH